MVFILFSMSRCSNPQLLIKFLIVLSHLPRLRTHPRLSLRIPRQAWSNFSSIILVLFSHSYYSVLLCSRKEKFYYYNYSSSDSTAFCIASISSAPNSPISANQSCSSDSSDSSDSTTWYSPSMPSCRSSVFLQILSTRHFSQRCCAIISSCFSTIPFMIVSIRPNLSDTLSSSSASSDSTSCSLSFPLPFVSFS